MSEQRIQTVKIVWKGDDAKSKAVEFTRSIKGADQAVEDLNTVMGKNATVTAKTVLSKKEITAQARKEFTAATRLVTKYNNLTTSLNQQIKMYGMTDDAAEVYTAQMRLGANATKAQRDEVARLITTMQKQRVASNQTAGSMRGLRGQAQNLGWQMQDVAVQMQMGTDKMVIFSQQGSQIASGFGPKGAIVGALIAVGGALAGVAMKALTGSASLKELEEAQKSVNEIFQEGAEDAETLTEKYRKLFKESKELALLEARKGIYETTDLIEKQEQTVRSTMNSMMQRADRMAKDYNITVSQAVNLQKVIKRKNAEETKALFLTLKGNKALTNSQTIILEAIRNGEKFKKLKTELSTIESMGVIQDDPEEEKKKQSAITRAFEQEYNRLIRQTETINEEYARRKKIIDAYRNQEGGDTQKTKTAYGDLEQWKTTELAKQAKKRADIARRTAQREERERERALEKQRRAIQVETKRREKVLNQAQKEIGKGNSSDPVIDEMNKHNRLLKTLYAERNALGVSSYAERQRVNSLIEQETDRHGEALKEAKITQMETDIMQLTAAANMMSATADLIAQGGDRVKQQTAEMNAFQKGMFLTTQVLAASMAIIDGISLGMSLARVFGIADPTMTTAAGYITAGASLGAAQAGAIMGTTFAGMFDSGGVIPNGQAGVVAERYDELVGGTMVYNNSGSGLNVTGSKDTAAAMSGGTQMNVFVENTASGVVRTQVNQLDENNVKIMISQYFSDNIDKGVSSVLDKKGSKADKSMRKNYSGGTRNY